MNGVTSNGIFSRSAMTPIGLLLIRSSLSNHGSSFTRPPIGNNGNSIAQVRADQVRYFLLAGLQSREEHARIAKLVLIGRIVQELNPFRAGGLFFRRRARKV